MEFSSGVSSAKVHRRTSYLGTVREKTHMMFFRRQFCSSPVFLFVRAQETDDSRDPLRTGLNCLRTDDWRFHVTINLLPCAVSPDPPFRRNCLEALGRRLAASVRMVAITSDSVMPKWASHAISSFVTFCSHCYVKISVHLLDGGSLLLVNCWRGMLLHRLVCSEPSKRHWVSHSSFSTVTRKLSEPTVQIEGALFVCTLRLLRQNFKSARGLENFRKKSEMKFQSEFR